MLTIASCDIETTITDISDPAMWATANTAGDLQLWKEIKGSTDAAAFDEIQTSGRGTPTATNATRTLNIIGYHLPYDQITLINDLNKNGANFYIAYTVWNQDGDKLRYWIKNASFKLSIIEPEDNSLPIEVSGTITWKELDELAAVDMPVLTF